MPPKPRPAARDRRRYRPLLLALVAGGVLAGALIAGSLLLRDGDDSTTGPQPPPAAGSPVPVDTLAGIPQRFTVLGRPAAKVTLIEYADLSCPVCRQFADQVLPTLVDEYVRTGKVKLEFRGLAFIKPAANSERALRHALAAGLQNRLWQFVELTYANQGEEGTNWFTQRVARSIGRQVLGLDVSRMLREVNDARVSSEIRQSDAHARSARVPGTPWFWIQVGRSAPQELQLPGYSVDVFRQILEQALAS
jgi:protein-disulfide isomerase